MLPNEGVEKPWTLRLLPFSFYFGYTFTPPKSFAWIVRRYMRSHFVGIAQNSDSGPFCTASTKKLSRFPIVSGPQGKIGFSALLGGTTE